MTAQKALKTCHRCGATRREHFGCGEFFCPLTPTHPTIDGGTWRGAPFKTARVRTKFEDKNGAKVREGERVRATSPNEALGSGVVVDLVEAVSHKPFKVRLDSGEVVYFHSSWTEVES